MLKGLGNILKTVRIEHVMRAFRDPLHALEAFKYHYRRVGEREFIDFFSGELGLGAADTEAAYRDLRSHDDVWVKLRDGLESTPRGYGRQMLQDGPALYLLMRLLKPGCVVETGVAAGVSSCFILQAMQDNGRGRLHSIEYAPTIEPYGKKAGWLVPEDLRHNWELVIGDSKRELPPLLSRVGSVDCFMHDSLHTYEHMLWEMDAAWGSLRRNGILLAHDVGDNRSFFDFMKEKGVAWGAYRVSGLLGGFRKN